MATRMTTTTHAPAHTPDRETTPSCDCECHHLDQHCERCCLDPDAGFCDDCAYYLELSRAVTRHSVR